MEVFSPKPAAGILLKFPLSRGLCDLFIFLCVCKQALWVLISRAGQPCNLKAYSQRVSRPHRAAETLKSTEEFVVACG